MAEAASQASLEIFNLALAHVGNRPVTSPADAPECQLHYPSLRDTELSRPWKFATFVTELQKLVDEQGEPLGALGTYRFLYALPNTPPVLRTLEIHLQGFQFERRNYTPPSDPEHPIAVIATSADSVILHYVGRITEGQWPPYFVHMMGLALGEAISMQLAKRPSLQAQLQAKLAIARETAITIDGHQDSPQRAILNQTYIHGRQESGVPPMGDVQEPLQLWP